MEEVIRRRVSTTMVTALPSTPISTTRGCSTRWIQNLELSLNMIAALSASSLVAFDTPQSMTEWRNCHGLTELSLHPLATLPTAVPLLPLNHWTNNQPIFITYTIFRVIQTFSVWFNKKYMNENLSFVTTCINNLT